MCLDVFVLPPVYSKNTVSRSEGGLPLGRLGDRIFHPFNLLPGVDGICRLLARDIKSSPCSQKCIQAGAPLPETISRSRLPATNHIPPLFLLKSVPSRVRGHCAVGVSQGCIVSLGGLVLFMLTSQRSECLLTAAPSKTPRAGMICDPQTSPVNWTA